MSAAGIVMFFISLLGLLAIVVLWLGTYSGHSFFAILEQTAAGSDAVEWPDEPFIDWLGKGVHFWGLVAFWPAVLWLILRNAHALGPAPQVILYCLALWLLFPVSLLSSLSATSPFMLLRWQVVAQLARRWEAFAVFAVVSPLILAGLFLMNYGIILGRAALPPDRRIGALVLGLPLTALGSVFALFVYARLVGKLCWIIRPPTIRKSTLRPNRLPLAGQTTAPTPVKLPAPRQRKQEVKPDDPLYGFQEEEPPPPVLHLLPRPDSFVEETDAEEADETASDDAGPQPEPPSKSWAELLQPSVFLFPFYERCRTPFFWLTLEWGFALFLMVWANGIYQNSIAPRLEAPKDEARLLSTAPQ